MSINDLPLPEIELPPTQDDLPYDDGEPMESPWHAHSGILLKACYTAFRGGRMDDYFIGVNMFLYYSMRQVRNQDYKGPDLFLVKNVDGGRRRLSWVVWDEDARFPDLIIELLSPSTEASDLGAKKQIYEQVFHTAEYFCVAPEVSRLLGWRLKDRAYAPIKPDARGWLWSEELGLWLGPWAGAYLCEEHTWLRLYHPDGTLVLTADEVAIQRAEAERARAEAERARAEAERARAEAERARADDLAARLAALEAELQRLRDSG